MEPCLPHAPPPQQMAPCARERSPLLREVGRRMGAWGVHPLESDAPDEGPARLWCKGPVSRRRRKHRTACATRCGPVVGWRRRSAPLMPGRHAIPPWELPLGLEAGVATPALAEGGGRWAAAHPQRQGLEMAQHAPGVPGAWAPLRKRLSRLRAGRAPQRQAAQRAQGVRWRPHARGGRQAGCNRSGR
jgi:hypothetical protein